MTDNHVDTHASEHPAEAPYDIPLFDLASVAECKRHHGYFIAGTPSPRLRLARGYAVTDRMWFESRARARGLTVETIELLDPQELHEAIAQGEEGIQALDAVTMSHIAGEDEDGDVHRLVISIAELEKIENPIVKLVDSTLYDALKAGASDVHLESLSGALHIRYRLDGVMVMAKEVVSPDVAEQVVSRIKVISDLDISERRVPQDGRFKAVINAVPVDFRVSIMPSLFGEDVVLRVLDKQGLHVGSKSLDLKALNFSEQTAEFIRSIARLPYGMLLVTGPTGSGKTTTLYAALSEVNEGVDKIVTIEDPIEYQLPGILQIPVNEKKGLTFAKGLRSILRHDPDKIMVGEIRDNETASIAIQAALTGHQVFTTVHANNVFDVVGRFYNMGVDAYSLVSALTGVMAQRLIRKTCSHCVHPEDPDSCMPPGFVFPAHLVGPNGRFASVSDMAPRSGKGCPECRGTGYKGRVAVAELLRLDDAMKDLILDKAPLSELKRVAKQGGYRSLRDEALALVCDGVTSLDEALRTTVAD